MFGLNQGPAKNVMFTLRLVQSRDGPFRCEAEWYQAKKGLLIRNPRDLGEAHEWPKKRRWKSTCDR